VHLTVRVRSLSRDRCELFAKPTDSSWSFVRNLIPVAVLIALGTLGSPSDTSLGAKTDQVDPSAYP
jgi:hypothetical protein